MQLHTEISGKELLPNVASIGFLDGLHRGPRFLIEQVCEAWAVRWLVHRLYTYPVLPGKYGP
jgi:FAD synthase